MENDITEVNSFGDARKLILQTIMHIRDGGLTTAQGAAMEANFRELNSNIQCEINAAKLQLRAEESGKDFGRLVQMGRTIINGEQPKRIAE